MSSVLAKLRHAIKSGFPEKATAIVIKEQKYIPVKHIRPILLIACNLELIDIIKFMETKSIHYKLAKQFISDLVFDDMFVSVMCRDDNMKTLWYLKQTGRLSRQEIVAHDRYISDLALLEYGFAGTDLTQFIRGRDRRRYIRPDIMIKASQGVVDIETKIFTMLLNSGNPALREIILGCPNSGVFEKIIDKCMSNDGYASIVNYGEKRMTHIFGNRWENKYLGINRPDDYEKKITVLCLRLAKYVEPLRNNLATIGVTIGSAIDYGLLKCASQILTETNSQLTYHAILAFADRRDWKDTTWDVVTSRKYFEIILKRTRGSDLYSVPLVNALHEKGIKHPHLFQNLFEKKPSLYNLYYKELINRYYLNHCDAFRNFTFSKPEPINPQPTVPYNSEIHWTGEVPLEYDDTFKRLDEFIRITKYEPTIADLEFYISNVKIPCSHMVTYLASKLEDPFSKVIVQSLIKADRDYPFPRSLFTSRRTSRLHAYLKIVEEI